MSKGDVKEFGAVISKLIKKENITREESRDMFYEILDNAQSDMHQGAFLAALAAKGETAEEIAGGWEAIYELDTVKVVPETEGPLVDNCGTGMDSIKTFNISTAASIVAAAAGITMAKHGARAITSICGTVDILEELGVDVECGPQVVKRSIEQAGIGIFNGMSPEVHPRALGRILSQISFGTVLNIAASLANPALPGYGVRGVYSRELLQHAPLIMREIGYKKALVVHGLAEDGVHGMDEASTLGETLMAELKEDGSIHYSSFTPEDLGIKRASAEDIKPLPDIAQEAMRLVRLLSGEENGAPRDIVCLNSGLILYLMGASGSIKDGYHFSREIIQSGKAVDKLKDWVREQNAQPEAGLARLEKYFN
ncbi:anthranilate phosphoribosyltransferase [Candidatus Contubernalis alkaliaceticus]|uniref:anthranilate phosphoribosyltransferase n=1 Tax=Candidatus Contubernalis alkaliaceticus TaxID=338645 RepID=UPI001F4C13D9|nr:anthranilate phosphoribosyltransferase [Candidatus Contubernalis alkalaceticus]UNC93349.1 anthranilate phosphoribosyltransferase [Candidatus Contubernalis alkalaceticus]